MAKTQEMTDPSREPGATPPPTEAAGSSPSAPTDMTRTGVQTSAGAPHSAGGLQVPVAPCRFGDYDLIEEVARGGMGVVYRARQAKLDRVVALKMILPGMLSSPRAVDRFYDEARAAAKLDHPHIVPIYDIGECDHQHYFTMAFVEGRSLRDLCRRETVGFREAARLLAGIAEGVAFAHDHKIVHRDLKPDNVLIDRQGRPRVTDFGLAKRTDASAHLTATGQILGTPTYMAPEQALGGNRTVGTPADVYALGGILYYTLTGHAPFQGETMTEILCQVVTTPPRPPREYNPRIPAALEEICLRCLAKEPADRYATAGEFRDALRQWLDLEGAQLPEHAGVAPVQPARPATDSVTPRLGTTRNDTPRPSAAAAPSAPFQPTHSVMRPAPVRPAPPPAPQRSAALPAPTAQISGSTPFVVPSGITPAVPETPRRGMGLLLRAGVLVGTVVVTALVVSQLPQWFGGASSGQARLAEPPEPAPPEPKPPEAKPPGVVARPAATPGGNPFEPLIDLKTLRGDFKLNARMLGSLGERDGVLQFPDGHRVRFEVQPERDCYVSIWALNGDGTLDQLFPHPESREHRLKKGVRYLLPPDPKGDARDNPTQERGIDIVLGPSTGTDVAWLIAGDRPFNPENAIKEMGQKGFLDERRFQMGFGKARNAVAVVKDQSVSEQYFRYRVAPGPSPK